MASSVATTMFTSSGYLVVWEVLVSSSGHEYRIYTSETSNIILAPSIWKKWVECKEQLQGAAFQPWCSSLTSCSDQAVPFGFPMEVVSSKKGAGSGDHSDSLHFVPSVQDESIRPSHIQAGLNNFLSGISALFLLLSLSYLLSYEVSYPIQNCYYSG